MAVIKELDRRGTLKNALAGRDEQGLSRLLNFLIGYDGPIHMQNMSHLIHTFLKKKIHKSLFFLPQKFNRHQVHACPGDRSWDDLWDLSFCNWPVVSGGPPSAAPPGPAWAGDRLSAGSRGSAGHVGHTVCHLRIQEGGAVLWDEQD